MPATARVLACLLLLATGTATSSNTAAPTVLALTSALVNFTSIVDEAKLAFLVETLVPRPLPPPPPPPPRPTGNVCGELTLAWQQLLNPTTVWVPQRHIIAFRVGDGGCTGAPNSTCARAVFPPSAGAAVVPAQGHPHNDEVGASFAAFAVPLRREDDEQRGDYCFNLPPGAYLVVAGTTTVELELGVRPSPHAYAVTVHGAGDAIARADFVYGGLQVGGAVVGGGHAASAHPPLLVALHPVLDKPDMAGVNGRQRGLKLPLPTPTRVPVAETGEWGLSDVQPGRYVVTVEGGAPGACFLAEEGVRPTGGEGALVAGAASGVTRLRLEGTAVVTVLAREAGIASAPVVFTLADCGAAPLVELPPPGLDVVVQRIATATASYEWHPTPPDAAMRWVLFGGAALLVAVATVRHIVHNLMGYRYVRLAPRTPRRRGAASAGGGPTESRKDQ